MGHCLAWRSSRIPASRRGWMLPLTLSHLLAHARGRAREACIARRNRLTRRSSRVPVSLRRG